MTFRPDIIVRTHNGLTVQILAVLPEADVHNDAIVGLATDHDGEREIMTWKRDGSFRDDRRRSAHDLIPPAEIVSLSPKLETAE